MAFMEVLEGDTQYTQYKILQEQCGSLIFPFLIITVLQYDEAK